VRLPSLPPPAWSSRLLQGDRLGGLWRSLRLDLPGAGQRRRCQLALLLAALVLLLRPWSPLRWLPGWWVGGLLLWAISELVIWAWRPRRWR
jgi:hypothetical protein